MNGLVYGVIKENYDTEHPGMVKVTLPYLSTDGDESFWARVMTPYGGKDYGLYFLPEAGDTVLVAFLHDDPLAPVVLGGCWNSTNTHPAETVTEKNEKKLFATKAGHRILFDDGEESGLTVKTNAGHKISFSDKDKKIVITTANGKNTFTLDEDKTSVAIVSGDKLSLTAKEISVEGKISLKGSAITLEADNDLTLKGRTVKVDGTSTKINGQTLEAVGGGSVKVESSGMLTLKGSMTKIN